jgi:hypothetical protein
MNIVQDSVTLPLKQTVCHMWLDMIVVFAACTGMAGRCGGLFVDDTCKWVVTLLTLD